MGLISEKFRTLLRAGAQVRDLPQELRAAGQHLDRYDLAQRGIFGTSAAIRVLGASGGSAGDDELLNGLVRYVAERPEFEVGVTSEAERDGLKWRLSIEVADTFKTADLVYSLATVSRLAVGRDVVLGGLVARLEAGRRPAGGWGAELVPDAPFSALATAHVVRAIYRAGRQVAPADIDLLHQELDSPTLSRYEATFVLLVLLILRQDGVNGEDRRRVLALWKQLEPETSAPSEANHDYEIRTRTYYVRVPWQIYLLWCVLVVCPGSRFLTADRQRMVLTMVANLATPAGFVYPQSGTMASTRTYAILFDFFDATRRTFAGSPWLGWLSRVLNGATRFLRSRLLAAGLGAACACLLVLVTLSWLNAESSSWAEIAPNLVAAALLGLGSLALRAYRR